MQVTSLNVKKLSFNVAKKFQKSLFKFSEIMNDFANDKINVKASSIVKW